MTLQRSITLITKLLTNRKLKKRIMNNFGLFLGHFKQVANLKSGLVGASILDIFYVI